MLSATDPSGIKTTNTFDKLGRLEVVKDFNDDILKRYGYNYASYITASSNEIEVPASGGNNNVGISSNTTWAVTDDANWITVTPLSGNFDGVLTITRETNTIATPRTGQITITGGNTTESITINQEAAIPSITIIPTSLYFTSGGSQTANVSASVNWTRTITYYSGSGWLMVNPDSGSPGNTTLIVTVSFPPESGSWSAEVKLSGGGANNYLYVTVSH